LPTDAGPDADAPESGGPVLTAQELAADAICARQDEVANCPAPASPCREAIIGGWNFNKENFQNCVADIDAYFNCIATEPVTSYDCAGDNTPEITIPNPGNCSSQETAFYGIYDNSNPCNPP
jgi:hypothetical protein